MPRFLSAATRDPAEEAESLWERPEEAEIAAAYVAIVREQIELPAEPAGEGLWSVPGALDSGSEPPRETQSPA